MSDAPTTTILLFTTSFDSKLNFLLMRLRANGACEEKTDHRYTANRLAFQNLAVGNLTPRLYSEVIRLSTILFKRKEYDRSS